MKTQKTTALILAAALAVSASAFQAAAVNGESETEILVEEDDNELSPTGWKTVDGKRYYYINGEPVRENMNIYGVRYVFDKSGVCHGEYTGKRRINGQTLCYVEGILQTGWFSVKDKWYYADNNGAMRTGWTAIYENSRQQKGRYFYYFGRDGVWDGREDHTVEEYEPATLEEFLKDYTYPEDCLYQARAEGVTGSFVSLDDISVVKNVLERNKDKVLSHDQLTETGSIVSKIPKNSDDFILIRSDDDVRGENRMPTVGFYRSERGKVYFYAGMDMRFGCELDDGSFYDELVEIIKDHTP